MEKIESVDTLVIRQRKEWSEILTGFEARNRYEIMDPSGQMLYMAAELEGSFWTRIFLKAIRPFTMYIMEPGGGRALVLDRPFRFYFHRLEILGPNMKPLGTIPRRFSILRRKYSVLDDLGMSLDAVINKEAESRA